MINTYAWRCFRMAVHCLNEKGTLQERLTHACLRNFRLLEVTDLPPALQAEFRQLLRDITRVRATTFDHSMRVSIYSMGEAKILQTVARIQRLHQLLSEDSDTNLSVTGTSSEVYNHEDWQGAAIEHDTSHRA